MFYFGISNFKKYKNIEKLFYFKKNEKMIQLN